MKFAKRIASLLLSLALLLTMGGFAEDEVVATEAPAPEVVEEIVEEPAPEPEPEPTPDPTEVPTPDPTEAPTPEPTEAPTEIPTEEPTVAPTAEPEEVPTEEPEADVEPDIEETVAPEAAETAGVETAEPESAEAPADPNEGIAPAILTSCAHEWEFVEGEEDLDSYFVVNEEGHYALYQKWSGTQCKNCRNFQADYQFGEVIQKFEEHRWGTNYEGNKYCLDCGHVHSHQPVELVSPQSDGFEYMNAGVEGHYKVERRKYNYVCIICGESFYEIEELVQPGVEPHVNEDGDNLCDLCDIYFPSSSDHVHNWATDPTEPSSLSGYLAYKFNGGTTCSGKGELRYEAFVCSVCGEKMYATVLYPDIEVELPHDWVNGQCENCGAYYTQDCPHLNLRLSSESQANDTIVGEEWVPEDSTYHSIWWDAVRVYQCRDCGTYVRKHLVTKDVEEHYYRTTYEDEDVCEYCGATRKKAAGGDEHEHDWKYILVDIPTPYTHDGLARDNGNGTHRCPISSKVTTRVCKICGEENQTSYLSSYGLEYMTAPHSYTESADVCDICGAKNTCTHPRAFLSEPYDTTISAYYYNSDSHMALKRRVKYLICPDCGANAAVAENPDAADWSEPEPHEYDRYGVCACGAGNKCQHTGAKTKGTAHSTACFTMMPKDDKQHIASYAEYETTICADCGQEISRVMKVLHGADGNFYEPHRFDDFGVCANCGYKRSTATQKPTATPKPTPTPIPGVTIEYPAELTLTVGDSTTPKASSSVDKGFTYTSSDSKTVAVSTAGKITAKQAGSAVITVTGKTSHQAATCAVTVLPRPTKVTVTAPATEIYLDEGALTLTAAVEPTNAAQEVTWKSSNAKIATVKDGVVTPVMDGTVTITATAVKKNAKGKAVSGSVKITIVDRYKPKGIALEPSEAQTLAWKGAKLTLVPVLTPDDAESDITWKSSNTKIAKVDANGLVTSQSKEGTVTITATTVKKNVKGKTMSASVKVTVVDPEKPTKITLSQTGTISQRIDEPLELTATVEPESAVKDVTWKSSNSAVVKVLDKATGELSLEGAGTATITATTVKKNVKGKALSASVKVTVVDPYRPTGIKLEETGTLRLAWDAEPLPLHAILQPEGTAESKLTWKSSNTKIATVDENGQVTPLKKEGTATITATTVKTNTKGKKMSASVKVTVFDPERPTKIALNQPSRIECQIDQPPTLIATMEPSTAVSELKWSSSNKAVAEVDSESGVLTLKSAGSAKITVTTKKTNVTTKKAMSASVTIAVKDPYRPAGIALEEKGTVRMAWDKAKLQLHVNLTAENPEFEARSDVTWKSSNEKIATVDAKGEVTSLKKEGTVTITATTVKKNKKGKKLSASVKVKVEDPTRPEEIAVTPESLDIDVHSTTGVQLKASVSRADGDAKSNFTWKTSNAKIAKVNKEGLVTPVKVGTATITATATQKTPDGKTLSQKITVRVYDPAVPFSVTLQESGTQIVKVGGSLTLHADVFPATAETTLKWSSSSKAVADVTDGIVTGKKAGTVTITVQTSNGKKASVKVKVEP